MLEVKTIHADYGNKEVLKDISFSLTPGETLSVIGPSGCGKTTLLHLLSGLKTPSRGEILFNGNPVFEGDPEIGLILQQFGLFPWMTVMENVELGLKIRGEKPEKRRKECRKWLDRMRLHGMEERYPNTLSGGQQQRVALARTLVTGPALLLMDEPFSSLDSITRETLQELLSRLLEEISIITVFVTHSIEEAIYLGDKVLLLSPEPGRIVSFLPVLPGRGKKERDSAEFASFRGTLRKRMREETP